MSFRLAASALALAMENQIMVEILDEGDDGLAAVNSAFGLWAAC